MKNTRKVLFISSEFPPGPGGIGNLSYNIQKHLSPSLWEIDLFVKQEYSNAKDIKSFNQSLEKSLYRMSSNKNIAGFVKNLYLLRKIIKRNNYQIVITSGRISTILLGIYKALFNFESSLVTIIHGPEYLSINCVLRILCRIFINSSSRVICVSNFTRVENVKFGINKNLINVINNGASYVQPKTSYNILSDYPNIDNSSKLLITIGSVTERKGQVLVIKAMEKIIKKYKNCHYLIIGTPILEKEYSKLASDLNVHGNVHFLGVINNHDKASVLARSDIFMLTSQFFNKSEFEGFGIALIEAAFYGLPAIATNTSGISDAVVNNKTGYLCNENHNEIADKVIHLLDNENLCNEMGNNAKQRAFTEFSWDKKIIEYDTLLKKL